MGTDDTVIGADETVIGADETIISADDTVISADDTVISVTELTDGGNLAPTQPMPRIPDVPARVSAPTSVFTLRLVTGARYGLSSAVIVGRAPRVARLSTDDAVQLVSVSSREGLVSSTHAELRQVGDVVVVTDLRSTNGTRVTLPNGVSRQLAPGDSMALGEGAVVDIGDGNRIEVLRETPRDASNDIAR
jgi:FHA domain